MRVGIIGAGNIAQSLANAVNGLADVELYAIASRDMKKAEEFAVKFGVTKAYGSYEEMLEDEKVDLVYVATPHSHHYEHAKMCIEHGKAALVEKAFTANAAQARELIELAEQKKVLLTEAIWTRYMPSRYLVEEAIKSGIIGDVKMITAQLSYPITNVERMTSKALAGGSLLDLGVYPINFAAMFMGTDIADISGTCTYTESGVDCQEAITITYKNGNMAVLGASMCVDSHRYGHILGTKGYIDVVNINNIEEIRVYNTWHQQVKTIEVPKQINGYEYQVLACKKALEEGRIECPDMPHSESLLIMEWMDKLRKDWGVKFDFE